MQNFSMDPPKREPFHATLKRIVTENRGPRSIIFCRAVSVAPIKRPITRRLLPRICMCDLSLLAKAPRRFSRSIDRSMIRDSQTRANSSHREDGAASRLYLGARRLVLFARLL